MASKEEYAQWIVANADKKGTPEFETVAAAYKASGDQQAQPAQAQQSIPGLNERITSLADPSRRNYDPTDPSFGMSGGELFAAGAGKAVADAGRGAKQALGFGGDEEIEAARERDAPLMKRGAAKAGNIAGTVGAFAPAMLVPGAQGYVGAAATGALMGATQPTVEGESRAENTLVGAGSGFAGRAVAGGLSRMLNPQTAPAVRELLDEDIKLMPGQIMGGLPQRLEEAAKAIPFVGDGIKKASQRGIESFNKAALNRVLAPIGQKVDDIGHSGVEQAGMAVSKAYDDALATLKRVDIDQTFTNQMKAIDSMAKTLPAQIQKQLKSIIQTNLDEKITPAGTMTPQQLKTAANEFRRLGQGFKGGNGSFDQQQLGDALLTIRGNLYDLAGRIDPATKTALKSADEAFAQLIRVERAAGSTGAVDGVFTPAQLAQAAKAMDQSLRKKASARGKAPMQNFAEKAKGSLSPKMADSGTTERALLNTALLGGGAVFTPALAGGAVAARGLYTPVGQNALTSLLAKRPEAIRQVGQTVRRLAAPAAATGSALTTRGN